MNGQDLRGYFNHNRIQRTGCQVPHCHERCPHNLIGCNTMRLFVFAPQILSNLFIMSKGAPLRKYYHGPWTTSYQNDITERSSCDTLEKSMCVETAVWLYRVLFEGTDAPGKPALRPRNVESRSRCDQQNIVREYLNTGFWRALPKLIYLISNYIVRVR